MRDKSLPNNSPSNFFANFSSIFFSMKFLKAFGIIFGFSLLFFLVQLILVFSVSLKDDLQTVFNSAISLPPSQYWRFFYYGLAQVGSYFIFSVLIFIWTCFGYQYHETDKGFYRYASFVFLVSACWVFAINLWQYPASRFNWFILPGHSALPFFLIISVWFIYQTRFSFYGLIKFIRKYYLAIIGLIALAMLLNLAMRFYKEVTLVPPELSAKPNVIIIGMDDLRPDSLPKMPVLSAFLAKSTHFTQSITPEARTFVAWTSLLTGLYPKAHGIRFDMDSVENYAPAGSLAKILKDQGYATFYSTDDDQYANVTKKYGFDHVLVGIMDAAEYVLSDFNDFPVTNLISQTWLGQWWFPDTYNNRAAPFVYHPLNYNQQVLSALRKISDRPIFIAIHFNLSHQPFYWSKRPLPFQLMNANNNNSGVYYQASADMDWQFSEFLKGLKAQGLLRNSIVVVLSDHGEALGLPGDRLVSLTSYVKGLKSSEETIPALSLYSNDLMNFSKIFGHGTDVVSKVQWNNVLGIKWFGHSQYMGKINQQVSLVDVKPTILSLLGVSDKTAMFFDSSNFGNSNNSKNTYFSSDLSGSPYVGKSLAKIVLSGKPFPKDRFFFSDTGFNPIAIQDLNNVTAHDLENSMKYFVVLPDNGRMVINPMKYPELIEQIQRAVIYQDWVLAEYPARHPHQVFVIINAKTHQWTDDFSTPFAKTAPISEMLKKMKEFYGDEINIE